MDVAAFLSELCALPGVPGIEGRVAERVAEAFGAYTQDVRLDRLGNVMGTVGGEGPTVLLCAHMDEIGLIVTDFDGRAGLRFSSMGGVDPRVLAGCEVTVHGREPLYGVIGVRPPHLVAGVHKAPRFADLVIDTGYSVEKLKQLVSVGDPVTFNAPLTKLANGRISGKTFDDRACVASLLCAMEELRDVNLRCRAVFCATISEEVGMRGAKVAGYGASPDLAVALDVTHGPCPGAPKERVYPLDAVALAKGPLVHPALYRRLKDAAESARIKYETEISNGRTGTDLDAVQIAREGVPCALISVPLSYMHTTVETISEKTVKEAGRLLAQFLRGVGSDWKEWLTC